MNGDHIKEVFHLYSSMLYKISSLMLGNISDANDAVQETFLKYMLSNKKFSNDEHEKAWLIRVNINICKNMLRFHRLHPTVEFDVLNLAYQDEKDYELMASLFRLGKKEKEVLILRYIEGYANKEIATILGVSENAVKKRLERAKKKANTGI